MEAFLHSQLDLIIWFQSIGDWLTGPMLFFTALGEETFFLLLMPAFVWNYDVKLGIRLGYILLLGTAVNALIKLALVGPRPYWISDRILALRSESSFGLPSGHAWTAAALWGRLAIYLQSWVARSGLVLLIVLIGVSRVYLGVHFPIDVLSGWLGGLTFLLLFMATAERLTPALAEQPLWLRIFLFAVLSLLLIVLGAIAAEGARELALPTAWRDAIAAADPKGFSDPRSFESIVSVSGALLGLAAGSQLLGRGQNYEASGTVQQWALRYLVGVLGIVLLFYGLSAVSPQQPEVLHQVFRYTRYGLVGAWISFGAPRVFQRLRLA